jgi:hypothetical protein
MVHWSLNLQPLGGFNVVLPTLARSRIPTLADLEVFHGQAKTIYRAKREKTAAVCLSARDSQRGRFAAKISCWRGKGHLNNRLELGLELRYVTDELREVRC